MKKTLIASLLLAGLSAPAFAQTTPWYATLQLGQSKYDIDGLPGDNKDRLAMFGVGYQFNPALALEGGYADFGKVNVLGASGKAQSPYVAAVLSAPFADQFSVYGRLGVANTKREINFLGFNESDRKTEALYGLGVSYNFTKAVTGTLEYMKLNDSDVEAVSLGVRLRF